MCNDLLRLFAADPNRLPPVTQRNAQASSSASHVSGGGGGTQLGMAQSARCRASGRKTKAGSQQEDSGRSWAGPAKKQRVGTAMHNGTLQQLLQPQGAAAAAQQSVPAAHRHLQAQHDGGSSRNGSRSDSSCRRQEEIQYDTASLRDEYAADDANSAAADGTCSGGGSGGYIPTGGGAVVNSGGISGDGDDGGDDEYTLTWSQAVAALNDARSRSAQQASANDAHPPELDWTAADPNLLLPQSLLSRYDSSLPPRSIDGIRLQGAALGGVTGSSGAAGRPPPGRSSVAACLLARRGAGEKRRGFFRTRGKSKK